MIYINDEFTLFSIIILTITILLSIVFLTAYFKITAKIRTFEYKKKEDTAKQKQAAAQGKESFVMEAEKDYAVKLEKLKNEYGDKLLKTTTLIMKVKNITSTLNAQVIIREITEVLKNNIQAARAIVYIKSPSGKMMAASKIGYSDETVRDEIEITELPVINHCFQTKKITHVDDAYSNSKTAQLVEKLKDKTIYAVPFLAISEGELLPVGAIAIEKLQNKATRLETEDVTILSMLSSIIGNALINASDLESSKKFSEEQLQEKKKLTKIFSKYVSSQVVDELMKNPDSTKLGGKKQKTTIMFSDIRGFTSMSEKMEPENIVSLLNEYLSNMSNIIFNWNGTLDKYIGDAIMALFGAPIQSDDDELRAVAAAIEMQKCLQKLNHDFTMQGKPNINIGIGINTGEVVVGNVGSENRLEYTAIGDSVNLASRLCSVAKAGQVIISESTYNHIKDHIEVIKLDMVQVKGKEQKVQIYQVASLKEA